MYRSAGRCNEQMFLNVTGKCVQGNNPKIKEMSVLGCKRSCCFRLRRVFLPSLC